MSRETRDLAREPTRGRRTDDNTQPTREANHERVRSCHETYRFVSTDSSSIAAMVDRVTM